MKFESSNIFVRAGFLVNTMKKVLPSMEFKEGIKLTSKMVRNILRIQIILLQKIMENSNNFASNEKLLIILLQILLRKK